MTNFKNYLIGSGAILSRTLIAFALVLALVAVVPAPAVGQTTMTATTLSRAITSNTATTVYVASATGITGFSQGQPTTWIVADREAMAVFSVSGTTLTVLRGQGGGSGPAAHANSAKVWVGPPSAFGQQDPIAGSPCTSANLAYVPLVVPVTGNIWNCGNSLWTTFGQTFSGRLTVGALLTQAATITPTNPVHHITVGSATITTIVIPPAMPATGGCIQLIPDGAVTGITTSTGGNVALATTAVANKLLTLCYDPVAAKWFPSY